MSETSTDQMAGTLDDDFKPMEPIRDTKVAPAHGIAAMALSFAIKYHGINTVSDGVLYQQYKMEGRNMHTLGLADVFETAIHMERHLITSEERIASMIADALILGVEEDESEQADPQNEEADTTPEPSP